ncbi:MAG: hypothetical protein GY805_18180 [Chloroflexi bacterium]|nr:hypothetical protein [Chloroflexota bacterium]
MFRQLAAQIGAVPNQCYDNAFAALPHAPETAEYVEGFLVSSEGVPVEHAWLMIGDGTVIDPPLPDKSGSYIPIIQCPVLSMCALPIMEILSHQHNALYQNAWMAVLQK